jgi:hypothetical protein
MKATPPRDHNYQPYLSNIENIRKFPCCNKFIILTDMSVFKRYIRKLFF